VRNENTKRKTTEIISLKKIILIGLKDSNANLKATKVYPQKSIAKTREI